MKDLIVIAGPTASGKTAMAIQVAKQLDGEIINADSMQVYHYLDIGTAKPTMEERAGIPHHLLDIVDPRDSFSVAKYCELAHAAIRDIQGRGKLPVLVGGTGLYIDSVVANIQFSKIDGDMAYRRELENLANVHGNEYIYQMLQRIDSESASKITVPDTRRIVRALELYHVTGKTMTQLNAESRSVPSPYRSAVYAPQLEREVLYQRINRRVDGMMEAGLLQEVESLVAMGLTAKETAMQAIGYKEFLLYLEGKLSLDDAVEQVKQGSRRYAKRQLTWFRRNQSLTWVQSADQILSQYKRC